MHLLGDAKKMLNFVRRNINIRNIMYFCLRYSGLPFVFREIFQKNKVTILFFHEIEPEVAEKVFKYLVNNYNIISLSKFFELYRQKAKFPEKSLIITFDDGHQSNYDLLPLFKKYNIQATIFLCSGIINTNRHFWFKEARSEEACLPLTKEQLKKIPNNEKLKILETIGFELEKEYPNPHALSKKQILEMLPYVNFQSHTLFHPCLPQCDDSEARDEIFLSKRVLEEEYGLTINAIAYPNGDYSERDIQLCITAGYEFGLTTDFGFNTCSTAPFKLKRISVNETSNNMNEIITNVSGVTDFIVHLLSYRKRRTD
jgi:peptidoglycan/xylan/chitin deacetylase (PgdA/CDA1 family)